MRIRVIFLLKNRGAHIPFHHQYLLAQMVKGVLLSGGDEAFYNNDHYNFSGLKGQTKPSRKGLHYYSTRVTLVISSDNKELIDYFLLNLFKNNEIDIGGLLLEPEKCEVEHIDGVYKADKFICISPLVLIKPSVTDHTIKEFIAPNSDSFSDLLYEVTMQHIENQRNISEEESSRFHKFEIVPDMVYIKKLEAAQKKFSRVYPIYDQDVKFEVRGYTFPFQLLAEPEVREFVFLNGLGELTHKGFGMIDIANQNPNDRVEIYNIPDPKSEN